VCNQIQIDLLTSSAVPNSSFIIPGVVRWTLYDGLGVFKTEEVNSREKGKKDYEALSPYEFLTGKIKTS